MYFNEKKSNTNIDSDFKDNNNILLSILSIIKRYKIIILIAVIVLVAIFMILMFVNKKINNYLRLEGEEVVTIYLGTDYVEAGFKAYNSKDEDLSSSVKIESTLNINQVGEYEIIYTLGDITRVRKVKVIDKPMEYTYIYLKPVNNNVDVYLKVGEKYVEPGYQVFTSSTEDLTDKVKVIGKVDTSKKGTYTLVYSIVDSNNVTISETRTIIVMDLDVNLSLSNKGYTNGEVTINVSVIDEYFDYIILPNNKKVTSNTYSYKISENGKYTFTAYSKKGMTKKETIVVSNIDKNIPTGSCTIDQYTNKSVIAVDAKDDGEISKYVYDGKEYTSSTINVLSSINSAKVTVYDKAGNMKDINCTVSPKVYINSIKNDGVIVTVDAKKVGNSITGYYFSYSSTRPDKSTGGYVATNKESIDVVRLPGTTYVWVEDSSGKISNYKTITIGNDALFVTNNKKYTILQNKSLSTFLSEQGWSIEGLNKLIARSVRAAGLYSKKAAATSAVALQTVLAQKYKIVLPYWWGGKSWDLGAEKSWGEYRYKYREEYDKEYLYDGLDCSGFTTWAYVNAGYNVGADKEHPYPAYFWGWLKESLPFNKANGEIGDFIVNPDHVKLIVGKTDTAYITAEATGSWMVIGTHAYDSPRGNTIEKGELLMNAYEKFSRSSYPSGF